MRTGLPTPLQHSCNSGGQSATHIDSSKRRCSDHVFCLRFRSFSTLASYPRLLVHQRYLDFDGLYCLRCNDFVVSFLSGTSVQAKERETESVRRQMNQILICWSD
jgi:hypothetical protein